MNIINSIGAGFCLLLGIVGFISPNSTAKFVGILPDGKRGISEIRATYGGVFAGLGGCALYLQDTNVFTTLGIAWAGAAIARVISIIIDKSYDRLNFGGVFFESLVAIFLLWR